MTNSLQDAIQKAKSSDVSVASVINAAIGFLNNPSAQDLELLFLTLLSNSNNASDGPASSSDSNNYVNPDGAVGLLIAVSHYFSDENMEKDAQECEYFCRSVTLYAPYIAQLWRYLTSSSSAVMTRTTLSKSPAVVVQAVGCAVTVLKGQRCVVSRTGIIPALQGLCLALSSEENGVKRGDLTVVHPEFMQACLIAGHYRFAAEFADRNQQFCINASQSILPDQYLRYFYLLGIIYGGCNRWSDAVKCFNICISTPAQTVSAIVSAAYKKLIFSSLLSISKKPSIPNGTSTAISRFITTNYDNDKSIGLQDYDLLADAFLSFDMKKFQKRMNSMSDLLKADGNYGLASLLVEEIRPNIVKKVSKIYEVISLSKLAEKLGLESSEDAQELIMHMIARGDCVGKIDQHNSYIEFKVPTRENVIDNEELLKKILQKTGDCMTLSERVKGLDISLSTSTKYQSSIQHKQKKSIGQGQGGGDGGDKEMVIGEGGRVDLLI